MMVIRIAFSVFSSGLKFTHVSNAASTMYTPNITPASTKDIFMLPCRVPSSFLSL